MEKQSPVQRIWELGKDEHGKLITAVILAVVGVVCGMVPYFAAAKMIALLLAGERALGVYASWPRCAAFSRGRRFITGRWASRTRRPTAF